MRNTFWAPKKHISKNKDRDVPYKPPHNEGISLQNAYAYVLFGSLNLMKRKRIEHYKTGLRLKVLASGLSGLGLGFKLFLFCFAH